MQICFRPSILLACILIVLSFRGLSAQQPGPLVLDPEASQPDPIATRPLIGIRANSQAFIQSKFVQSGDKWGPGDYFLSEEVLIDSFKTDPRFLLALKKSGINPDDASLAKLRDARISLLDYARIPEKSTYSSIKIERATKGFETSYDATGIIAMTAAGAFELDQLTQGHRITDGGEVAVVPVNREISEFLQAAYRQTKQLEEFELGPYSEAWPRAQELLVSINKKHPLSDAVKVSLGDVSFGRLKVMSAKEAKMKISPAIAKEHDVYYVEFALTFYDLAPETAELSFRVQLPESFVAWELAPLKVAMEDQTEDKIRTPEITIDGVSVGTFFERQIIYKSIRPQIVAYGLRENQFSWSLTDQAISPGSHLSAAAIGVPKNLDHAAIELSAAVQTEPSIPILVEGNSAITEIYPTIVTFK